MQYAPDWLPTSGLGVKRAQWLWEQALLLAPSRPVAQGWSEEGTDVGVEQGVEGEGSCGEPGVGDTWEGVNTGWVEGEEEGCHIQEAIPDVDPEEGDEYEDVYEGEATEEGVEVGGEEQVGVAGVEEGGSNNSADHGSPAAAAAGVAAESHEAKAGTGREAGVGTGGGDGAGAGTEVAGAAEQAAPAPGSGTPARLRLWPPVETGSIGGSAGVAAGGAAAEEGTGATSQPGPFLNPATGQPLDPHLALLLEQGLSGAHDTPTSSSLAAAPPPPPAALPAPPAPPSNEGSVAPEGWYGEWPPAEYDEDDVYFVEADAKVLRGGGRVRGEGAEFADMLEERGLSMPFCYPAACFMLPRCQLCCL